jgi:ADP-heptose:LPS heptosyltransferase
MKILVLSLLRLGDILLHREVLQNLRRQHPRAQIHCLIFSQFQSVCPLVPEVDHWHFMDRQEIQKILVERQQSPLMAYQQLQTLVETLNGFQFNLLLNFTHNRFSVRLMDLIQANEKRGVSLHLGKKVADQSPWQAYLNENFSENQGSRFHYLDVLQRALGLSIEGARPAEKRQTPLILMQLLTSDVKKNWGLKKYKQLKSQLEQQFPQHRILGLCSPQEKQIVSEVFAWNEFLTPSLEETASLLKEATLLITGDTSIQHLASQNACPVVSLFLGSADPQKTGPWQTGAWVLHGKVACAPCVHSSPCHQKQHLCADSISVEQVFNLVQGIIAGTGKKVRSAMLFQSHLRQGNYFLKATEPDIEAELEQEVWSRYLNGLGSEGEKTLGPAPEKLQYLMHKQKKFEKSIQLVKSGGSNIHSLEKEFPEWKDCLIRWKRNFQFTEEVDAICRIRRQILQQWNQEMETENVRSSQSTSQRPLAEA